MNNKTIIALSLLVVILPYEINGFYNSHLVKHPAAYWIVELFTWIVMPSIILWWLLRRKTLTLDDIGIRKPESILKFIGLLILCIIAGPILYNIYKGTYGLTRNIFTTNYLAIKFSYKETIPQTGLLRYLVLIYHACSAGIVEEIFYRGIFRKLFDKNIPQTILYVVCSSLVFSSGHWEGGIHNLVATFMFGLVCATFYT
jgi:membrane protease YdiL (CAAX protease family)